MSVLEQWCGACQATHPHAAGHGMVVCTGCGLVNRVHPDLLALALSAEPVQGVAFCRWCRETQPVGHDCPAGAVGCTERAADETPCGGCEACIAAQRSDPRYGSPSDLDAP